MEDRPRIDQEGKPKPLLRVLEAPNSLKGFICMCAWCNKVRDGDGRWSRCDRYLSAPSPLQISHGICPECMSDQLKQAGTNASFRVVANGTQPIGYQWHLKCPSNYMKKNMETLTPPTAISIITHTKTNMPSITIQSLDDFLPAARQKSLLDDQAACCGAESRKLFPLPTKTGGSSLRTNPPSSVTSIDKIEAAFWWICPLILSYLLFTLLR